MRVLTLLVLTALAALPAAAQEPAAQGGFQVGVAELSRSFIGPTSGTGAVNSGWDSQENGTALTLGFHVAFNLHDGQMIRLRIDDTLPSGTILIANGNERVKATTIGVLGEYLYHPERTDHGLYLLAGLGLEMTKVDGEDPYSGNINASDRNSAFAWDAGAGYQFSSRVSLDLRYASSRPTSFGALPWVPVSEIKNDRLALCVNFSF